MGIIKPTDNNFIFTLTTLETVKWCSDAVSIFHKSQRCSDCSRYYFYVLGRATSDNLYYEIATKSIIIIITIIF